MSHMGRHTRSAPSGHTRDRGTVVHTITDSYRPLMIWREKVAVNRWGREYYLTESYRGALLSF